MTLPINKEKNTYFPDVKVNISVSELYRASASLISLHFDLSSKFRDETGIYNLKKFSL